MRKKIDRDKVKELVEDGLNDAQVADELDCSARAIGIIRKYELEMPSSYHGRGKEISREKVKELWEEGMTDQEIADELDCGRTTVRHARANMGLEPNGKSRNKVDRDKVKELWDDGLSDRKIAEKLGRNHQTIGRIRRNKLGLKPNRASGKYRSIVTMDGADGEEVKLENGWITLGLEKERSKRLSVYGKKAGTPKYYWKRKLKHIKAQILCLNEGEIWFKMKSGSDVGERVTREVKEKLTDFFHEHSGKRIDGIVKRVKDEEQFELLDVNKV